jgi:hypothetical protein
MTKTFYNINLKGHLEQGQEYTRDELNTINQSPGMLPCKDVRASRTTLLSTGKRDRKLSTPPSPPPP